MPATRRSFLAATAPVLASTAGLADAATVPAGTDAMTDPDVSALVQRAGQAHAALMRGDVATYRSLIAPTRDFTLMTPFGGKPTRGSTLSEERWASIGRYFRNGREATLELVQAYRSDALLVLAVIERAHVEVGGLEGQDWGLRVTLVFRLEDGKWMLAHRHADPLAEGVSLEQAASITRRRPA